MTKAQIKNMLEGYRSLQNGVLAMVTAGEITKEGPLMEHIHNDRELEEAIDSLEDEQDNGSVPQDHVSVRYCITQEAGFGQRTDCYNSIWELLKEQDRQVVERFGVHLKVVVGKIRHHIGSTVHFTIE